MSEAGPEDIDRAVKCARKAFDEGPWPRMGGVQRGRILYRLADLIESHAEELSALEALDVGKPLTMARMVDIPTAASHIRYFAGWSDKIQGKTIPTDSSAVKTFAYTLREPIGVVGQITPW